MGFESGISNVAITGSLGLTLGVLTGDDSTDISSLALKAELPPASPPGLPDWLVSSSPSGWVLDLTYEDSTTSLSIANDLMTAQLDGGTRRFEIVLQVTSGIDESRAEFTGRMLDPWERPFGVEWLSLKDATLVLTANSRSGNGASIDSVVDISGKSFALTVEINPEKGADSTTIITAATNERFSTADIVDLVAKEIGAPVAPDTLPDLSLSDVVITVETGHKSGVAISGTANALGQTADVLFAVVSPGGESEAQVLAGVRVKEFELSKEIPALGGSVVEDIDIGTAALVVADYDGRLDSAALTAPVHSFYREFYDRDDFTLEVSQGLSLVANMSMEGSPLSASLDALGMGSGTMLMTGTVPGRFLGLGGNGSTRDEFALSVALPPMRPPGSPGWFRSGEFSLEITGQPSVELNGTMTLAVDGELLSFNAGAQLFRNGQGVDLSLYGVMGTETPWRSPFGIEWLVLNRTAVELSVDSSFNVELGFSGDAVIGEKDFQVTVGVGINAGTPSLTILRAATTEGFSLSDLVSVQRDFAEAASSGVQPVDVSLGSYPEVALKNIELKYASVDNPVLEIESGLSIDGDLHLPTGSRGALEKFAVVEIDISESGISAYGQINAYEVGPLRWDDIIVKLVLTQSEQRFGFTGGLELFDVYVQTEVDISNDSILFASASDISQIQSIIDTWDSFAANPAGDFHQLVNVFSLVGLEQPQWIDDTISTIATISPVVADLETQGSLLDLALGGVDVPGVPATLGTPGVISPEVPEQCAGTWDGDDCWFTPPIDKIPATPGVPGTVTPEVPEQCAGTWDGDDCWLILPVEGLPGGTWCPRRDHSRDTSTMHRYVGRRRLLDHTTGTCTTRLLAGTHLDSWDTSHTRCPRSYHTGCACAVHWHMGW